MQNFAMGVCLHICLYIERCAKILTRNFFELSCTLNPHQFQPPCCKLCVVYIYLEWSFDSYKRFFADSKGDDAYIASGRLLLLANIIVPQSGPGTPNHSTEVKLVWINTKFCRDQILLLSDGRCCKMEPTRDTVQVPTYLWKLDMSSSLGPCLEVIFGNTKVLSGEGVSAQESFKIKTRAHTLTQFWLWIWETWQLKTSGGLPKWLFMHFLVMSYSGHVATDGWNG